MLRSKRKLEMESSQYLKNSKMESGSSLLEKLPCELIWMILDYAPEAVFDLRLTSHYMKKLVNDYAVQPLAVTVVDSLIVKFEYVNAYAMNEVVTIHAYVQSTKSNLFELRLKLKRAQLGSTMKVQKRDMMRAICYGLTYIAGDDVCLAHFNSCFGRRIGMVRLEDRRQGGQNDIYNIASKLAEGTLFRKLALFSKSVTPDNVNSLLEMIEKHQVDHLEISTIEFVESPANALHLFSTNVRSLKITQQKELGIDRTDRFFLGVIDFNWAPIFLEMFTNKLATLEIDNFWYSAYLSRCCIEDIGKKLPIIKNGVWFRATCGVDKEQVTYSNNGHTIKAMLISKRKMKMQSSHLRKNSKMESGTSLLEKLPCELTWMIFNYVPEAVFDLRLTSRHMKGLVDIYGTQASEFPIVYYLTIQHKNNLITINAHVASRNTNLFELRLNLKNLDRGSRVHVFRETIFERLNEIRYTLMFDIKTDSKYCPDHFNSSFGGKIGRVLLQEYVEDKSYNVLSKLFHGTTIYQLASFSGRMSQDDVNILMEMADKHNIDHLEISTAVIVGNAAKVLCRFSSVVRSLKINQLIEHGIDRSVRYFLGVRDANWVPVFEEMFSNKLESLEIDNFWYQDYLTSNCINALGKKLPLIKEVWFKATCDRSIAQNIYTNNEHIVRAYHSFDRAFLAIEHFSKKNYASS